MFSQRLSKAFKMVLSFAQYFEKNWTLNSFSNFHCPVPSFYSGGNRVFCAVLKPSNQLEAKVGANETPVSKRLFALPVGIWLTCPLAKKNQGQEVQEPVQDTHGVRGQVPKEKMDKGGTQQGLWGSRRDRPSIGATKKPLSFI